MRMSRCRSCDKEFEVAKGDHGYYCSNRCQQNYQWKQTREKILEEGKIPNRKIGRRFLLERDGHKCQMPECGLSEWEGKPVPLVLDHVDGDSDNWALDNVRMICPNCDALTEHYKGKNRGRGRYAKQATRSTSTAEDI